MTSARDRLRLSAVQYGDAPVTAAAGAAVLEFDRDRCDPGPGNPEALADDFLRELEHVAVGPVPGNEQPAAHALAGGVEPVADGKATGRTKRKYTRGADFPEHGTLRSGYRRGIPPHPGMAPRIGDRCYLLSSEQLGNLVAFRRTPSPSIEPWIGPVASRHIDVETLTCRWRPL